MTKEEFDAFAKRTLDMLADMYAEGSALDFSEAHILCRKGDDGKTYTDAEPLLVVMAMPDLDDRGQRNAVQDVVVRCDAIAAAVKQEVWFVRLPDGAPPELAAKVEEASRARTLDRLEPPLRREAVRVAFEAFEHQIRVFQAEIGPADGKKRPLGAWEEAEVRMPRPNFRRWFPEMHDGVKTIVVRI